MGENQGLDSFFKYGVSGILGAGASLYQGLNTEFDFKGRFSESDARSAGQARYGGIGRAAGLGLGALLAPLTGGLSIAAGGAIGNLIGGAIGGDKYAQEARNHIGQQDKRRDAIRNMYEDFAREQSMRDLQTSAQAFQNERMQLNIPSI